MNAIGHRLADDACLGGDDGGMGAAARLQLVDDIPDVFFSGVQGNAQGCGDYLVRVSVPHKPEHVNLPLGEVSRFSSTLGKGLAAVLNQVLHGGI